MNPYASFLAGQDPISVIAATPERLIRALEALPEDRIEQPPAPGKWSVRETLCHLADTEIAFAFRIRQALAEPHHVIQPFDQDRWAAGYGAYTARQAVDFFAAIRFWNVALLKTMPEAILLKPLTHPERGEMTFQVLIDTMAGHDLNHLRQLERDV